MISLFYIMLLLIEGHIFQLKSFNNIDWSIGARHMLSFSCWKRTWDEDLIDRINNVCEPLGFSQFLTLHNTKVSMIQFVCRNAFVSGDITSDKFNIVLNKFRTKYKLKLDDPVHRDDLSEFMEWAKIAVAKHAAGNKNTLLDRLRREIS